MKSLKKSDSTNNKDQSDDGVDKSNYVLSEAEKNSKTLNEFANIRTSIEINKKLRGQFKGKVNAQKQGGFSINDCEIENNIQKRTVDVVFFFHGSILRKY